MDETALRNSKGEDAVSPFASCVLFLDGDVDAPTLVVDRGFGDERFELALARLNLMSTMIRELLILFVQGPLVSPG